MDLKKAQEYIKALKKGKVSEKNMFLIMFLLGALLFVIVLPTGSSAPTSEKGGLDENKRKENKNSQTGEYETYIEEKTSSVLSQVKGAGKVTVMVTLKSNGQKLIEKIIQEVRRPKKRHPTAMFGKIRKVRRRKSAYMSRRQTEHLFLM